MRAAYAGNVATGLAMLFFLGSFLAGEHEALGWVCLVAALLCLSIDWRQTRAATRR